MTKEPFISPQYVHNLTTLIEATAHRGILLDVGVFIIHTMNPVGREAISSALHNYYNVRFADPAKFVSKEK